MPSKRVPFHVSGECYNGGRSIQKSNLICCQLTTCGARCLARLSLPRTLHLSLTISLSLSCVHAPVGSHPAIAAFLLQHIAALLSFTANRMRGNKKPAPGRASAAAPFSTSCVRAGTCVSREQLDKLRTRLIPLIRLSASTRIGSYRYGTCSFLATTP